MAKLKKNKIEPNIYHCFGWPTRFPTSKNIGSGSNTVFKRILSLYFNAGGKGWADPMCGRDKRCEFRNDIRLKGTAGLDHEDALIWLKKIPDNSLEGIIYDPPYNDRQGQIYTKLHHTKSDLGYWYDIRRQIVRTVKPGGLIILFAWNTNIFPSCALEQIYIISHGSERNDTLVSIHRKSKDIPIL